MVATDRNAIGLMRVLSNAGLVIPRDLAIVSFDNMEEAAFSSPTLTSVNQHFAEVGALAGRLVIAQINGAAVAHTAHVLPRAPLELRGSCGCVTDALGTGIDESGAPRGESPDRLSAALQAALCESLLSGHSVVDTPMRDAASETVRAADHLLYGAAAITAADVQHLTTSLHRLPARPESCAGSSAR